MKIFREKAVVVSGKVYMPLSSWTVMFILFSGSLLLNTWCMADTTKEIIIWTIFVLIYCTSGLLFMKHEKKRLLKKNSDKQE